VTTPECVDLVNAWYTCLVDNCSSICGA
jgi:hypothetical protein